MNTTNTEERAKKSVHFDTPHPSYLINLTSSTPVLGRCQSSPLILAFDTTGETVIEKTTTNNDDDDDQLHPCDITDQVDNTITEVPTNLSVGCINSQLKCYDRFMLIARLICSICLVVVMFNCSEKLSVSDWCRWLTRLMMLVGLACLCSQWVVRCFVYGTYRFYKHLLLLMGYFEFVVVFVSVGVLTFYSTVDLKPDERWPVSLRFLLGFTVLQCVMIIVYTCFISVHIRLANEGPASKAEFNELAFITREGHYDRLDNDGVHSVSMSAV